MNTKTNNHIFKKSELKAIITFQQPVIIILSCALLVILVFFPISLIDQHNQINSLKVELQSLRAQKEVHERVSTTLPMHMSPIITRTLSTIQKPAEIEKYSEVPLDDSVKQYILDKCNENNIPPEVVFAMAWKESSFNPNAKSSTGDHGLLQINECNFKTLQSALEIDNIKSDIYDPYTNIDCSIHILKQLVDGYNNSNWHQVLMRYNMGPGGAAKCFKKGIYSSHYSRDILNYANEMFGFSNISIT